MIQLKFYSDYSGYYVKNRLIGQGGDLESSTEKAIVQTRHDGVGGTF